MQGVAKRRTSLRPLARTHLAVACLAIGASLASAAGRGMHPAMMPCLNGLGVAIITSFWIDWTALTDGNVTTAAVSMLISGLAMTAGMIARQTAMKHGGHGLAWAVAQSGLACSFVVAVLFHGERPGLIAWLGLIGILISLPLLRGGLQIEGTDQKRNWFGYAMIAWVLIGLQQSAFQWPSLSADSPDRAGIRVPIMCAVAGISSGCVLLMRQRESPSPKRPAASIRHVLALALMACTANAIAQPSMARACDLLARQGAAGIAFPIAMATCITLFVLFACWHRHERPQPRTRIGLAFSLTGVVMLSL